MNAVAAAKRLLLSLKGLDFKAFSLAHGFRLCRADTGVIMRFVRENPNKPQLLTFFIEVAFDAEGRTTIILARQEPCEEEPVWFQRIDFNDKGVSRKELMYRLAQDIDKAHRDNKDDVYLLYMIPTFLIPILKHLLNFFQTSTIDGMLEIENASGPATYSLGEFADFLRPCQFKNSADCEVLGNRLILTEEENRQMPVHDGFWLLLYFLKNRTLGKSICSNCKEM